jgi:hypothetical protein
MVALFPGKMEKEIHPLVVENWRLCIQEYKQN